MKKPKKTSLKVRLPFHKIGDRFVPIPPNGPNVFTVHEVAELTGRPAQDLATEWLRACRMSNAAKSARFFIDRDGRPIPVDANDTRTRIRGRRVLSLAEAAKKADWSEAALVALHELAFPQAVGTISYHPELANWLPAGLAGTNGPHANVFPIHVDAGNGAKGAWIASIEVNPAFDRKAVNAIAWLMSRAPLLWRTLRNVAPHLQSHLESCDDLHDVIATLFESADRWPFQWLTADDKEEAMMRERDAASEAKLMAQQQGRTADHG
jgi:hypothetical protein